MARRIASFDEMIEMLSSIKGEQFVTIGYFSNAKMYKTGRNVDMEKFGKDLENDNKSPYYPGLKKFQSGGAKSVPYNGIVKVTINQFNYMSEDRFNKAYSEYSNKRDEIQKRYGNYIAPEDRKHSGYTTKIDYGKGSIAVGNTENTRNNVYVRQNGATAKLLRRDYYFVDANGNLYSEAVNYETIREILSKSSSSMIDGEGALRKVTQDKNIIKQYTQEINKLNFSVFQLICDRILFISCTYNGEEIFFVNDKLTNDAGSKLTVNSESFGEIVAAAMQNTISH